jgi:hypothetical protein
VRIGVPRATKMRDCLIVSASTVLEIDRWVINGEGGRYLFEMSIRADVSLAQRRVL